jgi:methylated-DNA-protein-cysteine methyltransferase related protein
MKSKCFVNKFASKRDRRNISPPNTTYAAIYKAVKKIPNGKVATYGQIARLAGFPNHARLVGYALHALRDPSIPWHRVINARGEISLSDVGSEVQRGLLANEGIIFSMSGKVDLKQFGWKK